MSSSFINPLNFIKYFKNQNIQDFFKIELLKSLFVRLYSADVIKHHTLCRTKVWIGTTRTNHSSLNRIVLDFLDHPNFSICETNICLWNHSFKTSANFHDFWPLPPTIGIPAKCLWWGFFILMYLYDLLTIGMSGHPSPPKTCWHLKWMVPFHKK